MKTGITFLGIGVLFGVVGAVGRSFASGGWYALLMVAIVFGVVLGIVGIFRIIGEKIS